MLSRVGVAALLCVVVCISIVGVSCDVLPPIGTSTAYVPQQSSSTYQPAPDTCQPIQINLVARHGSRFPTKGHVTKLSKLQSDLSILTTDPGFDQTRFGWMLKWTNPYAGKHIHDGELIPLGMSQHQGLAQRLASVYPTLLQQPYDSDSYAFQTTIVPRAQVSGQSFAYGLFAGEGPLGTSHYLPVYIPNNQDDPNDQVLRFYAACDNYINNIKGSTKDDAKAYLKKYTGPIITRIQSYLNLTLPSTRELINTSLNVIMTACIYHISIDNQNDEFCTLFTSDDIALFVAVSDVSDYTEKSYGHKLNWQIAAPLMGDIIQNMLDKINKATPSPLLASFRFAHAETIMPFVSMLGLFEDSVPPTFDMTPQQLAQRLFQTSIVSPMAANTILTLYSCGTTTNPSYVVKLLHNEKEWIIPGCSSLYCPFNEFISLFNWTLTYDFANACGTSNRGMKLTPI